LANWVFCLGLQLLRINILESLSLGEELRRKDACEELLKVMPTLRTRRDDPQRWSGEKPKSGYGQ
jgi:hypothetical protein